jgi:deoxyribonuclease IV
MRLGAHISTAGGIHLAFQRAHDIGCDSMLIFTKSNRQWQAKPISDEDVTAYRRATEEYAMVFPVAVHASYLINIGSADPALWEKSCQALKIEVERAGRFGIPYLVFHPGSHTDAPLEQGLENIARGVQRVLAETDGTAPETFVCLETMAGQGTNIGGSFAHLAQIIAACGGHERLGVCFDTCHVFAGGYDIRTAVGYQQTMQQFDDTIGLSRLKCFHFNDSQHPLGSRKDRHEHIGQGYIGLEGFANFVNDPRWANFPAHLETPKTEKNDAGAEVEMDPINLAALRQLQKG